VVKQIRPKNHPYQTQAIGDQKANKRIVVLCIVRLLIVVYPGEQKKGEYNP
jgi:hypothetical protein